MLFSFPPRTRPALARLARLCLPLLLLGVGCGKSRTSDEADVNRTGDNAEGQATTVSGPVWRAESEAFSPSLPYLFDEGRIYIGQADQLDLPQSPIAVADYAFSAVDRHGRLYHFDNQGRWWMAPGHSLPAPLPPGGWDVAWDKATRQPELLVTAPWQGQTSMTLLRWSSGQWTTATVAAWSAPTTATAQATPTPLHLPAARFEACRRYLPEARSWLVAGGRVTTATLPATAVTTATTAALALARPPAGLLLERGLAHVWPLVSVTTATLAVPAVGLAPPATAPDLAQTRALLGATTDGTVNALLHSGDLWVWQAGAWHWREKLPNMDHLLLSRGLPPHLDAKHDPVPAQLLFVWDFGRGYDQIMLRTAQWTAGEKPHQADALNQTALVKLNEEDEGFWRGWGRVASETQRDGSNKELFTEGFKGAGEDAIHIQGEVGDVFFHRSQLRIIELPPELKNLRPAAAAWVPALGGLVVPSVDGVGLAAQRSPFFPVDSLTGTTSTTDTRNLIDVIQRTYRFWNFRGELIEWIKAPYDLHNQLGYPDSYFGENGKRRTLSWTFPQPGTFRFDFHEYTSENQQWVSSPLLTLRTLPQLAWNPTDELIICDPVVWGDPAEIILIGWCGRLTRPKAYKELKEELGGEVYTEVPTRGFMARISALNPQDWQVTNLPIAFCQGARLVVDGGSGKLWLVGGRVAMPRAVEGKPYLVMGSNTIVWEWNGKTWSHIKPQGTVPRMKVTSNVAFDTRAHQLLSLTPRSLYAFEGDTWQELWTRPKPRGEDWPDQLGLYVHPLSNLTLGIWFKEMAEMHVWAGHQWQPVAAGLGMDQVTWDSGDDSVAGGPWPNLAENLIPALANDAFISIDGEQLARLRMDVPRNRDEDRLLGAHWISLRFDEQTQLITPAPGLLGLHAEKK